MNIAVLCGGVGAAKLLQGFHFLNEPSLNVSAIVNTADDDYFYGLKVCPDIDSILYHLSDLHDKDRGWGRRDETFNFVNTLKELKQQAWFNLGDKDLALNYIRTELLNESKSLTEATETLKNLLGIKSINVLPMTDDEVSTQITSGDNIYSMQEYFVQHKCEPVIERIEYKNVPRATTQKVRESLVAADLIVIAPSNPYLSILPIIEVEEIKTILMKKRVAGISPIVGNKSIKGPLSKILRELALPVNWDSIANIYSSFLNEFIIDQNDSTEHSELDNKDLRIYSTNIILDSDSKKRDLARFIVESLN